MSSTIVQSQVEKSLINNPQKIHMKQLNSMDIEKLINGEEFNPHNFLGLHALDSYEKVIRLWRPGAHTLYLEVFGEIEEATRVDEAGLFEFTVPQFTKPEDYRVYHQSGLLAMDPYAFWPSVGETDQYLFGKGVHYQIHKMMGGRLFEHQGCKGTKFVVWAPAAKRVSLIADFNHWNGLTNPMRSLGRSGLWEIFVPGVGIGEKYKFEIKTQSGQLLVKSDPYAYSSEFRPATGSVVAEVNNFNWQDKEWITRRISDRDKAKPINIYEVHLGSWRKREGYYFQNYREIAEQLAKYCLEMGFTHVELLPIQEHPLDESWGYQVSGFYAVTSRFGTPQDFQWFVNHMHVNGIGVILDWVPGHFPTDLFSLGRFDGTALYEHEDTRQGFHPHWNTYIFNFGRHEVSNFLLGNALYWCEVMHIDGLRVDAVASMLYLDYGRESGEWIPNIYGGKENLDAIEFFKHLNSIVHEAYPGVLTIAEESTSFPAITHSLESGGLGFDMKWNMGWMNDTLRYFAKPPFFRHFHQNDLTFGLLYAFTENFTLVLSHDEVVHGKKSLMGKMPGDPWQQFANMRLLYSYMICQPGKKLLFMGGEIGQWNEWNSKGEIEWGLLQFPIHNGLKTMVKELNHFYIEHSILWERDFTYTGFEWIDLNDHQNCVLSYYRKGTKGLLLCIHNFTPNYHGNYFLSAAGIKTIREVFNSDAECYGGSGKINGFPKILTNENGHAFGLEIQLAPLATMIFEVGF